MNRDRWTYSSEGEKMSRGTGRGELFDILRAGVKQVIDSPADRDDKLRAVCTLLRDGVPYYDWVGFYVVDAAEENLILGPFSGDPTEHVEIPMGSGICGQAAERKTTFIVQDVRQETNYLSCSPEVKSEIVIPIMKDSKIVGELDIDSHALSPFGEEDRELLEEICEIISVLF
jgi:GAF domain-containing protein